MFSIADLWVNNWMYIKPQLLTKYSEPKVFIEY